MFNQDQLYFSKAKAPQTSAKQSWELKEVLKCCPMEELSEPPVRSGIPAHVAPGAVPIPQEENCRSKGQLSLGRNPVAREQPYRSGATLLLGRNPVAREEPCRSRGTLSPSAVGASFGTGFGARVRVA